MDGNAPALPEADARIPPHCLDAEAAVLSACFVADAAPELEPEHFYSDANRLIFAAIRATRSTGPVDAVLVANHLRASGQIYRVGGATYIAQIIDATPCVANVAAHAALVREMWRRRVLIAAFQQCEAELYHGQVDAAGAWRRMKGCCDA
jgi:replicative DNA helicase